MNKKWIDIPKKFSVVAKLYLNAIGIESHCHKFSKTRIYLSYIKPQDISLQAKIQYVLETLSAATIK